MIHELLDKLKKLKALEDGARSVGSLAEAENAAEKYQSLLLKHNLDEEQVMNHAMREKIEMLHTSIDPKDFEISCSHTWVESLLHQVALSSLCHIIKDSAAKKYFVLGEKQNVAACLYMMEQLVAKISVAKNIAVKHYTGNEPKGRFSRSFVTGAANAISIKLRESRKKETANQEMGLMVVSKMQKAKEYSVTVFGRLGKSKVSNGRANSADGYTQGYAAGQKIDANKGISNNQKQIGR